jgi:hypothetical protein
MSPTHVSQTHVCQTHGSLLMRCLRLLSLCWVPGVQCAAPHAHSAHAPDHAAHPTHRRHHNRSAASTPKPVGSAARVGFPVWVLEYAEWHAANRHARDAKYLVYTCRPSMPGTNSHCLGFGDRFRLIGFMLRMAAVFGRVLLLDWDSPAPLADSLAPATFDWRLTPAEEAKVATEKVERWLGGLPQGMPHPKAKYVRVVGNAPWQSGIGVPAEQNYSVLFREALSPLARPRNTAEPKAPGGLASYGCLWNALFAASPSLAEAVAAQRSAMFGSATAPYAALHLRLGDGANGSAFDQKTVPTRHKVLSHTDAVAALRCARHLAGGRPLFVATENGARHAHPHARRQCCALPCCAMRCSALPGALKAALRERDAAAVPDVPAELIAGGADGSGAMGGPAWDGVRTQGCARCMINAVFGHDFDRAAVSETFVELALLAQATPAQDLTTPCFASHGGRSLGCPTALCFSCSTPLSFALAGQPLLHLQSVQLCRVSARVGRRGAPHLPVGRARHARVLQLAAGQGGAVRRARVQRAEFVARGQGSFLPQDARMTSDAAIQLARATYTRCGHLGELQRICAF